MDAPFKSGDKFRYKSPSSSTVYTVAEVVRDVYNDDWEIEHWIVFGESIGLTRASQVERVSAEMEAASMALQPNGAGA